MDSGDRTGHGEDSTSSRCPTNSMTGRIEQDLGEFEVELGQLISGAKACVQRLRQASSGDLMFLYAERLPALGSVIIPELQAIIGDETARTTLRYLAAWIAVSVGDRGDSVNVLCAEVSRGSEWSLPAANALARYGIREGIGVVTAAVERVDPRNGAEVLGYLTALRDLGGKLPDEARCRILGYSTPWVARAIEQDFFPGN